MLNKRFIQPLVLAILISFSLPSSGFSQAADVFHPNAHVSYTHWQDLPDGPLKRAFAQTGSQLINNVNIVKLEDGKPVLIRGGGFTQANLDWLIKDMGVRTIIDLRGKFSDDKTDQLIALSPAIRERYESRHQLNKLKNLSPDGVNDYVTYLRTHDHIPAHYYHLRAEDPRLLNYLNQANPQKPLAMFCQWGFNRSGTAWGRLAKSQGWSLDQALKAFGALLPNGTYKNKKDIEYGFRIQNSHS